MAAEDNKPTLDLRGRLTRPQGIYVVAVAYLFFAGTLVVGGIHNEGVYLLIPGILSWLLGVVCSILDLSHRERRPLALVALLAALLPALLVL